MKKRLRIMVTQLPVLRKWNKLKNLGEYKSDDEFLSHLLNQEEQFRNDQSKQKQVLSFGTSDWRTSTDCDIDVPSDIERTLSVSSHQRQLRTMHDDLPRIARKKRNVFKKPPIPSPNESVIDQSEPEEQSTTKPKTYACDLCEKRFLSAKSLRRHRLTHSGNKLFSCSICNKRFTRKCTMNAHNRLHTKNFSHICEVCERGFIQKQHLEKHMATHAAEKPFLCECGKRFTQKSVMLDHQRLHNGELYLCDTCGRGFTTKNVLAIHRRIHTGERPFACDTCGKTFTQLTNLNIHKQMHSTDRTKTFSCQKCDKSYFIKSHLTAHVNRTHSKEQPSIICNICKQTFSRLRLLNHHMRLHRAPNQPTHATALEALTEQEPAVISVNVNSYLLGTPPAYLNRIDAMNGWQQHMSGPDQIEQI